MAEIPFRLVCSRCSLEASLATVVCGSVPMCSSCGGDLQLPQAAILGCRACRKRSRPGRPDVNKAQTCPGCGRPLEVLEQPALPSSGELRSAITRLADPGSVKPKPKHAAAVLKEGQFGHFAIKREIARGGMGVVYEAEDRKLRRTVALKVLIAGEEASEELIQRFVREARAASHLRHPNIVTVHEAGTLEGRHFFTMDFVRGREFAEAIHDSELRVLVRHLADVAAALDYAHDQGVIHRDLKPANIMIDEHGRPQVMDFGLARDANDEGFRSLTGQVLGTPSYMSPEQARGLTHELDARSDIYSLGAVLYEAACKRKPFQAATLFDTLQAVINAEPTPPRFIDSSLDRDLETIILKCLEKDASARYACMAALAADLEAWLDQRPIAARAISPLQRQWRRLRRNPGLLATMVAVPVVVLLLGIILVLRGGDLLDEVAAELASQDPQRQQAALVLLQGQLADGRIEDRPRACALVRDLLDSPEEDLLIAAIALLAQVRDEGSIPAMLTIAQGKPERPAIAALDALGVFAESGFGDTSAVSAGLEATLQQGSAQRGVRAVHLLDRIQAKEGTKRMIAVAENASLPIEIRCAGIDAVGRRSTLHSEGMICLLGLLADDEQRIRDAAEVALAATRSRPGILAFYGDSSLASNTVKQVGKLQQEIAERQRQEMALLGELGDPDARPQSPITKALTRLRSSAVEERLTAAFDLAAFDDAKAIEPLLQACGDRDRRVRRAAARSLAQLAVKHAVETAALAKSLADLDPQRRADAANALALLEAREQLPALLAAWTTEQDGSVQRELIRAFGACGDASVLSALGSALASETLAAEALSAAVRLGKTGQPILIEALSHRSRSVREDAHAQLVTLTGNDLGSDPQAWR